MKIMNKHALIANGAPRILRLGVALMIFAGGGLTMASANGNLSPAIVTEVMSVQQANKKVVSKVIDEMNMPVSGATIIVKGTTRGVIADMDGNF